MYNDNERSTGVESLNNARIKTGRVFSNVKSIANKTLSVKRNADKFMENKALKEHFSATNNKSSNIHLNARPIGKSICKGTVSINGRITENLYNKNDDTNSGINSLFATEIRTRRTVETGKNIVNNSKTIYRVSKDVFKYTAKISKNAIKMLSKLILSNPIISIVLIVVIILILSVSDIDNDDDFIMLFSGMGTEVIVTDESNIDRYRDILINLDEEFNESVYSGNYAAYDMVEINRYASTSLKEILSFLTVLKEQNIECNSENINDFKIIHSSMYSISSKTSTYECDGCYCTHDSESNCPGNCSCIGHQKIEVDIIAKTFDEMCETLNLDKEQKEMARRFSEKDYKDIYSNLE